jgi:IS5 family transposase
VRQFVGIGLGRERVPDETTILNFRHLLERHDLTQALLDRMNAYLASRGLQVKSGTIVDATIIAAPSSTKNQTKTLLLELVPNFTIARARRHIEFDMNNVFKTPVAHSFYDGLRRSGVPA